MDCCLPAKHTLTANLAQKKKSIVMNMADLYEHYGSHFSSHLCLFFSHVTSACMPVTAAHQLTEEKMHNKMQTGDTATKDLKNRV